MHSHSHGSGFVLLQVLLWSDYPGVWEQRPVSLPELLDVTLVVHDLQYGDTTGQKAHDTGRKFCMLQKLTLALNLVNRQNIFHSWRLLKLLSAWATVRNLFLVSKLPKISRWDNSDSLIVNLFRPSDVPVKAVKLELCASVHRTLLWMKRRILVFG